MSLSLTRPRVLAAALTALAVGAAGLVVVAPQAQAAPETVVAGSANWGFKESWRNYLGMGMNDGSGGATVAVADGLAFNGTTWSVGTPKRNLAPYTWPLSTTTATTYDPVAHTGSIRFGGKVTYTLVKHWIQEVTVANPTVVLNGDGTGDLLADVKHDIWGSNALMGDSGNPKDAAQYTQYKIADLSGITAPATSTSNGQIDTYSNINAVLTADGATALGLSFSYGAGTALDKIGFGVCFSGTCASPTTTKVALSPATVAYGTARTAKVTVSSAVAPTGTVTLKEGTRVLGAPTLSGGSATVKLPANLSVGRHTLTASYPGATGLLASSGAATLVVVKAGTKSSATLVKKTVKVGTKGKVTAKVTATGFTPTGKVQVKKGSKVLATATLSGGKKTITLPKLKKGKHKLTVRYVGSGTANVSTSSKVTLTVKKK